MQRKPISVYVHIPFCVQKCLYCDFLSGKADEETKARYVEALLREIEAETADGKFDRYEVRTVYFGGGTPSLLSAEQIEKVLCKLKSVFLFQKPRKPQEASVLSLRRREEDEEPEISMEVNPGTVDINKLCKLHDAGINRISIGVQSLQDAELAKLGRIHRAEDFYRVWEEATTAGFRNRNVDLMSGIPGQTVESLADTITKLVALSPEHISAYSLIVEEGTPFAGMYPDGAVDEDTDRQMYELTGRLLARAGYGRYEISNYAKEGFACRHNTAYWTRQDYVGFGIGAASLFENVRYSNTRSLHNYISGCNVHENVERLTLEEQMAETMFLGLRMTQGISDADFMRLYGKDMCAVYGPVIEKHEKEGLIVWENGHLHLTERGLDVSNYVMADFV